tara:strand:- start:4600 stop:4857 length:258 start_codon:yes stop_codon:yes gene_type:complete
VDTVKQPEKAGRTVGFGEMLRVLRKREQLTQEKLAARLGVTNASVSLYESGRRLPGRSTIAKLPKALNLTSNEFILMLDVAEQAG